MAKSVGVFICALLLYVVLCSFDSRPIRLGVIATFSREVGVRERTNSNDGKEVEKYLRSVGLRKGNPWCAAFVSWCYTHNGVPNPRSGWSPYYFPEARIVWKRNSKHNKAVQSGDVFGIWFNSRRRIAHVGFVLQWSDRQVVTVEGNTNQGGSREGDGVYRKIRLKNQIYAVANWVDNY